MVAVAANLLGIFEQLIALLAVPSHMGSYILHFSFGQRNGVLAVAGIAGGTFIISGSKEKLAMKCRCV